MHRLLTKRARRRTRLVGYWRSNGAENDYWPDPTDMIDSTWPAEERERVAAYLDAAPAVRSFRGYSPCRICGINNGSAEHSDGSYLWPEGLAHYVRTHAVKLPDELLAHIYDRLSDPQNAEDEVHKFNRSKINYSWWRRVAKR